MYILEFHNLPFAKNIKITNIAMDDATKSPIFYTNRLNGKLTSLKEKIFNTEKFKIYTKAKISTCTAVNISLLMGLCLSELQEHFK